MAMDKDDVIDTLNDLIETCKDGEEGFMTCAEDVKNFPLKETLMTAAQHCRDAAQELQREVQLLGGKAETSGSLSGSAHRRWVDVKSAITGKSDASVLAECERGEDVAKESYQRALEKDLPPNIRAIVERQYRGVLKNHDQVRALEIAAKAAS
ncbi:MAG: PA2169 family four-helix-bundle protein [Rhodospirillaceae bacterium]